VKQTKICMYIKGCLLKSMGTSRISDEGSLVWLLSFS
jgi:hypothetical protein